MTGQPSAATSEPEDDAGAPDGISRSELISDKQVGHYIDIWKQTIEVQMHFNDLEWRIRGLALTVATFALGAAAVAAKDGTRIGWLSLGSLVLILGLLLWYAFYFVDKAWYHPLLKGSVDFGTSLEQEIQVFLPKAGLTAAISAASGYRTTKLERIVSRKNAMNSSDKLVYFYRVGAVALASVAVVLQAGILFTAGEGETTPGPTPSESVSPASD